jgi:Protein of unknown function (DUF2752)
VKRFWSLAGLALLGGLVSLAVYFDFPLCPMASTFGVPCPGCGLTRATLAVLHGDLHAALHFHPLVWLLAPLFAVFVGGAALELVHGPYAASPLRVRGPAVNVAAALVLGLTVGVWVARFAGYFGGPAPVTSMSAWLLGERGPITR